MQGGALRVETVLSGFSRRKSLRGLHRPVRVSGFRDSALLHFLLNTCLQTYDRIIRFFRVRSRRLVAASNIARNWRLFLTAENFDVPA